MSEEAADQHMADARKHVKTSLFKRKPDYRSAAEDYEKAAAIYSGLRSLVKARESWRLASDAHEKSKSLFFAGRALERLGVVLVENAEDRCGAGMMSAFATSAATHSNTKGGQALMAPDEVRAQMVEAATSYEQAAALFEADANMNCRAAAFKAAAEAMKKLKQYEANAAKQAQGRGDSNAVAAANAGHECAQGEYRRYINAAMESMEHMWEAEGRSPHKLADLYNDAVVQNIRSGDMVSAIQASKRMIGVLPVKGQVTESQYDESKNVYFSLKQPTNAAKTCLEVVVMCLAADGDSAWANTEMMTLRQVPGFEGSNEGQAAAALLSAFAERDPEILEDAIKNYQCFMFLKADVSRMVKKLKIGGAKAAQKEEAMMAPNAAATLQASPEDEINDGDESLDPEEDLR